MLNVQALKGNLETVGDMFGAMAVGAIGGAFGQIGGAGMTFAENLILGTTEGAITGGLTASFEGTDVGKGALWGAAAGAVFTTVTSDNLSNALKGKKFKTNANVFKDFSTGTYTKPGGVWQQDALDYFGFDGEYLANFDDFFSQNDFAKTVNKLNGDLPPNTKLGEVYYSERVFEPKNFDWLNFVQNHEMVHRIEILKGNIPNGIKETLAGEYRAYHHNIKNLGHYPNFSIKSFNKQSLLDQIDFNGGLSGLYNPKQYFYYKRMT